MAVKEFKAPFFVAFGTEGFFLDQVAAWAKSQPNREVVTVSATGMTDSALASLLRTTTMRGLPRTVILDDAQQLKISKGSKEWSCYFEETNPKDTSVVLVALVRSEKLPSFWSQVSSKGATQDCAPLKPWGKPSPLAKWVISYADSLSLNITTDLVDTLISVVGTSLYNLSNELRKLSILAQDRFITIEDIKTVVVSSVEVEPYQIADAVFSKNGRLAFAYLARIYQQDPNSHVGITHALIKTTERVLLARHLYDKQTPPEEIATYLGMHPWRYTQQVEPLVKKASTPHLLGALPRLKQLDSDTKSGAISKKARVETTILHLLQG